MLKRRVTHHRGLQKVVYPLSMCPVAALNAQRAQLRASNLYVGQWAHGNIHKLKHALHVT